VNREPTLDDVIDIEQGSGAERQRLQHVHELLLEAGPPPELSPKLQQAPNFDVVRRLQRRRVVKQRAMVLLAAALSIVLVFVAGYAVANNGNGSAAPTREKPAQLLALQGTSALPKAQGTLEVWKSKAGNWPMTLTVENLPKLPSHKYYEVYLVRNGRPWGSCGTFRVEGRSDQPVTVTLTAPYSLRKGDSWVVTQPGVGGAEPGKTVLRPVLA
jgi:hypothetical protein